MGWQSKSKIESIIEQFVELGVQKVAPCHCTGARARDLFKNHFGDSCILTGVGHVLSF